MPLPIAVADHIDHDGAGEKQHIVLPFPDIYAVTVGEGENQVAHADT